METQLVRALERVWGAGFLSPGGTVSGIRELLGNISLEGRRILDIGCGLGGYAVLFAAYLGAASVTGLDPDEGVLRQARALAAKAGLASCVTFVHAPGSALPVPSESFDVAFAKEAMLYVADKEAVFRQAYRALRPEGLMIVLDLMARDEVHGPAMDEFCALEDKLLRVQIETVAAHRGALSRAGFVDITVRDLTDVLARYTRKEARAIATMAEHEIAAMGRPLYELLKDNWRSMIRVLESGELEYHLIHGRKGLALV